LFGPLLTASGGRSQQLAVQAVNQALTLTIFPQTCRLSAQGEIDMAKQANAKQLKARRARVKPAHLKGNTQLEIALHDIITALKEIDRKKLTSKFVRAAKKNEAFARIDPTTVNFVKDFFADNNLHKGKVGKHIVNARGLSAAPHARRRPSPVLLAHPPAL
jgi:hypothetical protein